MDGNGEVSHSSGGGILNICPDFYADVQSVGVGEWEAGMYF